MRLKTGARSRALFGTLANFASGNDPVRAKRKRLWQRPNQSFFQILKICDTVKKANNGRKKWQIHLVVH
jgi:hypothetical protein